MLGKLWTRDRLQFLSSDTSCIFCEQAEENHGHLFFACSWSSLLWGNFKSWLHITRRMSTLRSAVRGLHSSGKSLQARMKKFSLSLTTYLIWEELNKRIFMAIVIQLLWCFISSKSFSTWCYTFMSRIIFF